MDFGFTRRYVVIVTLQSEDNEVETHIFESDIVEHVVEYGYVTAPQKNKGIVVNVQWKRWNDEFQLYENI